ncbi:hypothetical protein [Psychrobacillus sp.]|uniref:hypothetical protein n=1 Tax=Psychrobacillus sp. TaxID=1871623 RepID=UPI0028BE3647|nr:hypothetical protein [Psychrobacillus sp.]
MSKQIVWHECQKVWKSPIFLLLLFVFSVFDFFLIINNSYMKEELKIANELAETYGLQITEESLQLFEQALQKDREQLVAITGKKFSSVSEFFEQTTWEDFDSYSEVDKSLFRELELKEMYFQMAQSIDVYYDSLKIDSLAEDTIRMYGLSGKPAEMIRNEYIKLSDRFEEIKISEEHKQWAFAGAPYKMHSFLFRNIFGALVFQALVLVVLTTAFITNYEVEHKTHLLSFSTRRGRAFMKDKLIASLIMSLLMCLVLFGVTLACYFSVFSYTGLWDSPISSAFNWEYTLPYITWRNIPFIQFLLLVTLLLMGCMLLFTLVVFTISVIVKNSYFTFFIFAIFFALGYLASGFMPTNSIFIIFASFNLSVIVMNPHMLFSGQNGLGTMFHNYEVITIVIWAFIVTVTSMLAYKYFQKQSIQ